MSERTPTRVAVVTGTRAEWGLLEPVYSALRGNATLTTDLVVTGVHLLPEIGTARDIDAPISAEVVMQEPGEHGRTSDAKALGRGIEGLASCFDDLRTEVVVVLGDRIEAFAAASAASVGGRVLVHLHGGDRAEGVADEAMRHAITKLAHVHCCATEQSAERVRRMGERPEHVHVTGSPAITGLDAIEPMSEAGWSDISEPEVVIVHHGAGLSEDVERRTAEAIAESVDGKRTLWLRANSDPGSEVVEEVRERFSSDHPEAVRVNHLPRPEFVGMMKRLAASGGIILGNSSAALIECAALRVPAINIGPRQSGRERANNVIDIETDVTSEKIGDAMARAALLDRKSVFHPYGETDAAQRIGDVIADIGISNGSILRKRNTF